MDDTDFSQLTRGAQLASSKNELSSNNKALVGEEAPSIDIWDTSSASQELEGPAGLGSPAVQSDSSPAPRERAGSSPSLASASVPPPGGITFVGMTPPPQEAIQAVSASPPPPNAFSGLTSSIPPPADPRTPLPRGILTPGEQFGVYRVGACIGEGGMARIYQAEHAGLRRQVALKVLLDASTRAPEGRERFLREARIAAAIKHPNVVNIFDVGVHEGTAFLVMELLTGIDLEQLIEQRGALDEGTIIDIMVPVLAGLAAVHDAGVVHRDLKPGNVFLAQGRYDEVDPKLLDFGISKAAGPEQLRLTTNGMLIGTPFYMSPEGLRGEEMTPASDQYSLGVVMYECATGTNPFHASTFAEIFKLIGAGQYPPPTSTRPQISKRLERIIMRAMSLEPAERYKDLREMGRDLLVLAGQRTRITWALSFGEVDRPRTSGTGTWANVERLAPVPHADDEVPLLLTKRPRPLVPLLWTLLGAAIVIAALAWSGLLSKQEQTASNPPLPSARVLNSNAPTDKDDLAARSAGSTQAAAPAATTIGAHVPQGSAPAEPPGRPARRASWPQRRGPSAASAANKTDEANPDWAIAPSSSVTVRSTGQTRAQVAVGANGAPIFD